LEGGKFSVISVPVTVEERAAVIAGMRLDNIEVDSGKSAGM
jgi:hypothetical protein